MGKLGKRAEAALEVLRTGGWVEYRLIHNGYLHREQYKWVLRGSGGTWVNGFGHATATELINAGLLVATGYNTAISTEYKLREESNG